MTDPTQLMTAATGTPAQAASAEASVIVDEVAQIVTLPSTDGVPAQAAERLDQVRRGLSLDSLPGRDLDRHELRELVASIAADPSQWRQHVAFSDDKRHYVQLHRDGHVDVWVL
ncbi:MAG: cysteine dioxygenase, partial [Actinomycetes bacterium]